MKYIIIIVTVFHSLVSFSQKKDQALFNSGNEQYSIDKQYSIKAFEKLVDKYPKSKFYSISIYNLAQIYGETGNTKQSIQWFEFALAAKFKKNIDRYNFADTNRNIKHKSARDLAHIYYQNGDYRKSLEYYFKSLNDYPHYSISGTSTKKSNSNIKRRISDCYLNMKDTINAINILIPDAITATPWIGNPASKKVLELIIKYYGKEMYRNYFNMALNNMIMNEDYFSLTLIGSEIDIYPYDSRMEYLSLESFAEAVKEREFSLSLNE